MKLKIINSNSFKERAKRVIPHQTGIFMSPSWVALSYSHYKQDIELTLRMFDLVCLDVKKHASNQNYKNLIEGSMPKTVWMMTIKPTKKPANRLDTKC